MTKDVIKRICMYTSVQSKFTFEERNEERKTTALLCRSQGYPLYHVDLAHLCARHSHRYECGSTVCLF